MEDKNSFVFYETFLDFTDCLPEDERQPFIMSIIEYGIFGTVPEYSGAKKGLFLSIINAIDNSKERRRKSKLYGAMGGRTKKDSEKPMVNLKVSDEEMAARKAKWQPRAPKVSTGYLGRYASLVTSADKGAILSVK